MPPRRFSANYILPINGKPIRNGVIGIDEQGTIIEIIEQEDQQKEYAHTEFRNGIIVPGFINAHCHSELSHMKDKTQQGGGMAQFLLQVNAYREAPESEAERAVEQALKDMYFEGVSAFGDICNSTLSFEAKKRSPLKCFNFIELLGLRPESADLIIERAKAILQIAADADLGHSCITPHSTYSLSETLWQASSPAFNGQEVISIHFAESLADFAFSKSQTGDFVGVLNELGLPTNTAPKGSPLDILMRCINPEAKIILVHNTYLPAETIEKTALHFPNAYFCFCPQSNLFIEQKLPAIPQFLAHSNRLLVGTDSYASTNSLSMLEQVRIITSNFPSVSFNEVITWATLNGARALGFHNHLGSIEMGKKPGLVLITPFNFEKWALLPQSKARRLV